MNRNIFVIPDNRWCLQYNIKHKFKILKYIYKLLKLMEIGEIKEIKIKKGHF